MSPSTDLNAQPYGPPKWSALAVGAFVCALLGFLGFTAVLGVLFGIAGIAVTRKGERRGLGLAVAAIPISVLTGAIGMFVVYGMLTAASMYNATAALERALAGPSDQIAVESVAIYDVASETFRKDVSSQGLVQWLQGVSARHGNLVSLEPDPAVRTITSGPGGTVWNMRGKFTNGPVLVRITFAPETLLDWRVVNIEVDGVAVRPEPAG
jgi:hypothetical protein